MRTREDALRSVRRYTAAALGSPPWRVRMAMDGAQFERPAAIVNAPIPSPITDGGVDTVMQTADIFIQLFPALGVNASENKLLAERAGDLLQTALILGVPDLVVPNEVRGYRQLIPLWDYTDDEGEPLPTEGVESIAVKRTARDYLRVERGFRVQTLAEAPDDQLYATIVELRVQWFRNARIVPTGPVLESVEFVGDVTGETRPVP